MTQIEQLSDSGSCFPIKGSFEKVFGVGKRANNKPMRLFNKISKFKFLKDFPRGSKLIFNLVRKTIELSRIT